jgi:hypothetical protein
MFSKGPRVFSRKSQTSSWKTGKCSAAEFISNHFERSAAKSRNPLEFDESEFRMRDVSTSLDMTK